MAKYENIFKKMITEQEAPVQGEVDDAEAWENSFEEPENMNDFSTEPNAPGFEDRYIEKAKGWISKVQDFSDWVNGTEADSLNKQFIDLDNEGSPFEGISKHSQKLTKIAEDLAALSETIKGHILNAGKMDKEAASLDAEGEF